MNGVDTWRKVEKIGPKCKTLPSFSKIKGHNSCEMQTKDMVLFLPRPHMMVSKYTKFESDSLNT